MDQDLRRELERQEREIRELKSARRSLASRPATGSATPERDRREARLLLENAKQTERVRQTVKPGSAAYRAMTKSAQRDLEAAESLREGRPVPENRDRERMTCSGGFELVDRG